MWSPHSLNVGIYVASTWHCRCSENLRAYHGLSNSVEAAFLRSRSFICHQSIFSTRLLLTCALVQVQCRTTQYTLTLPFKPELCVLSSLVLYANETRCILCFVHGPPLKNCDATCYSATARHCPLLAAIVTGHGFLVARVVVHLLCLVAPSEAGARHWQNDSDMLNA